MNDVDVDWVDCKLGGIAFDLEAVRDRNHVLITVLEAIAKQSEKNW